MNVSGIVKVVNIESLPGACKAMLHEIIGNEKKCYAARFLTEKIKTVESGTTIEITDAYLDKTIKDRVVVVVKDFNVVKEESK